MDFVTATRGERQAGQTLVEFALVIPFIVVLFMGVFETALAMNATLAVNRASQHGAHIAATAGNVIGADCQVLASVERNIGAPNDRARIEGVIIERTALAGDQSYARQVWTRGGSTSCALPDGTITTVPYRLTSAGYPEADRCTVLGGCPALGADRSTVDNVGVIVRYHHEWVTPLNGVLDTLINSGDSSGANVAGGWTFEQRNIFRMEPTL